MSFRSMEKMKFVNAILLVLESVYNLWVMIFRSCLSLKLKLEAYKQKYYFYTLKKPFIFIEAKPLISILGTLCHF